MLACGTVGSRWSTACKATTGDGGADRGSARLLVVARLWRRSPLLRDNRNGLRRQPQWIVFTARSPGHGVEQIFRIKQSGAGLKQLTRGEYPSAAPAFSPDGKRIAFARAGSRDLQHEPRWDGRPPPDHERPRQLPHLVSGRQADRFCPAPRERVERLRHVGVRHGRAAAPPGASSRPAVLDRPRAPDSDRGRPRADQSSIRACSSGFGATIDAIVGMDATAVSPDLSTLTFVGAATAGSRGQGVRRRRPLSAVRALHRRIFASTRRRDCSPRCRTGVVLARREEPRVRGRESDRSLASRERHVEVDQDREAHPDGEHSSGLAAALSASRRL